nr:uncharacterized protein LOC109183982 [Ipomoea trifida]
MAKAQAELIGKGRLLNEADVTGLPYLQCIMKETFRLHPPAPLLLPHRVEQDVVLCGYTIPKDSKILFNSPKMATITPTDPLHTSTNPDDSIINTGHSSIIQQQPSIVHFDAESPYYLHSSDGTGTTLVGNVLTGIDNYNPWVRAMTMALKGRNKFCFVDGSLPMPDVAHPDHTRWHRVNNMVMSWILNSIHSSLANTVLYSTDAASAWTDLKERFSTANGPRIYEIEKRIATFSQRDASIADYHNHLSALWDELNQLVPPPKCTCSARQEYMAQMERRRLMQFLMGLRDTFAQPRSQLLLNVNLPTVKSAYSLLLQDESQRVQSEGYERPVDHSALQAARIDIDAPNPLQSHISSMPHFTAAANQSSTNRAHASSSTSRPGNNRPRPRCAHCGTLGHTQQVCYKLHGYPPGHKFYKKGNTNSQPVTAQSTSPIPSESLQQLIRLLQEVKEPKANLVGATDHVCFNLSIFTELPKYNNIVTNISVPTGNAIPLAGEEERRRCLLSIVVGLQFERERQGRWLVLTAGLPWPPLCFIDDSRNFKLTAATVTSSRDSGDNNFK